MGMYALYYNSTGYYNSAMGVSALQSNTTGYYNSAMGVSALQSNTTGYYNSAMGMYALYYNSTGYYNSAMGMYALYDLNITANDGSGSNTAIGYNTGRGITTGVNNTILGASVNGLAAGLSNNIILANGTGAIKAQHDGTNWAFTGAASFSNALSAGGNISTSTGIVSGAALTLTGSTYNTFQKSAAAGLVTYGIAGSTYDYSIVTPSGSGYVMTNPTGTVNTLFFGTVTAINSGTSVHLNATSAVNPFIGFSNGTYNGGLEISSNALRIYHNGQAAMSVEPTGHLVTFPHSAGAVFTGNVSAPNVVYGANGSGSNSAPVAWTQTDMTQWKSGHWDVNGASWTPDTGWYWGITTAHISNANNYLFGAQMIFQNNITDPTMYIRAMSGGAVGITSAWAKVLTDKNIDTTPAGIAAYKALLNAPTVGNWDAFGTLPATTGATGLYPPNCYIYSTVIVDTAGDNTAGTLYQNQSGTWVRVGVGSVIVGKIVAGNISAGAIGATAISAGAITTAKMTAGTINADRLTAGSITASQIAAGAITTAKLLVANTGANLVSDPFCLDQSYWNLTTGSWLGGLTDLPGGNSAWASVTGLQQNQGTGLIPVSMLLDYLLVYYAKTNAGSAGTNYGYCACYDGLYNFLGYTGASGWDSSGTYCYFGLAGVTTSASWTRYAITVGPNSTARFATGTKFIQLGCYANYSSTAGYSSAWSGWSVQQRADGNLIVDGCITTAKLNFTPTGATNIVGTINASSEGITINAAKLNLTGLVTVTNLSTSGSTTINGDNITTGTVATARLAFTPIGTANVVATINSSSEGITINAAKLNLVGLITATNLSTSGSTTINGDNITTGTVATARLAFTPIGTTNVVGTINSSSEGITINAAKLNLTGLVTVTNLSTSGSTTINGDNITTGTIAAARLNLSGVATISSLSAGTTTISGGCITTGTINASLVSVTNINATNITTGTLSANFISTGTLSATLTVTSDLTSSPYTAGTSTAAPAGFRLKAAGWVGACFNGDTSGALATTPTLTMEIGAGVSIGGYSLTSLALGRLVNAGTMFYHNTTGYTAGTTYNWVCPPGITWIEVTIVGGGGGSSYGTGAGAGGGGGGMRFMCQVNPGTTYTVIFGAGGTAGGGTGGTGGTSSFTGSAAGNAPAIAASCTGGVGGSGGGPNGGAGGNAVYNSVTLATGTAGAITGNATNPVAVTTGVVDYACGGGGGGTTTPNYTGGNPLGISNTGSGSGGGSPFGKGGNNASTNTGEWYGGGAGTWGAGGATNGWPGANGYVMLRF